LLRETPADTCAGCAGDRTFPIHSSGAKTGTSPDSEPSFTITSHLPTYQHIHDALEMPAQAPPARAQTIKQAKAAFKDRGKPALSDREKKQLERSIELDRRAWRTRETEKRKAEAAKKKAEKDKNDREDRLKAQLGSQRRFDKFGYKSNQMHLGAFLGVNRTTNTMSEENTESTTEPSTGDSFGDSFGDSGLDDETLLDALEDLKAAEANTPTVNIPASHTNTNADEMMDAPDSKTAPQNHQCTSKREDLVFFFDELGTSTQIARELTVDESAVEAAQHSAAIKALSFSSGDFDLTMEDIEEMEAAAVSSKAAIDRQLMPPPRLPIKPPKPRAPTTTGQDITLQDLEDLADHDIQLTQAMPG